MGVEKDMTPLRARPGILDLWRGLRRILPCPGRSLCSLFGCWQGEDGAPHEVDVAPFWYWLCHLCRL